MSHNGFILRPFGILTAEARLLCGDHYLHD
jgi:hypothetical protein